MVIVTAKLDVPIGLNLLGDPDKRFITLCGIRFTYGDDDVDIEEGYEYDGPSIPRPLWFHAGFSPADIDLALPSLPHDYGCEHPDKIPRALADSIFFETLGPITFNGRELPGIGTARRLALAEAVHIYSLATGKDWR